MGNPDRAEKERVNTDFHIGSYWDKNVQIDVVGLREDGWIDLGECKWGAAVPITPVAKELESKVRRYPNPRQSTIGRRLFVRSAKPGREPLPADFRVHTLEDLYAP